MMACKNSQAEELYEVAVVLLAVVKSLDESLPGAGPVVKALIRRAEKATARRPK